MLLEPGAVRILVESPLILALLGLAADALAGDPARLYARLPHPVAALGRLIGRAESVFNRPAASAPVRWVLGAMLTVFVTGLAAGLGVLAMWALDALAAGRAGPWVAWAVEGVAVSVLLAARGLHDAVARVAAGLAEGLEAGRAAVRHIVGRDPEILDAAGVARAATESAAENLSDAVVAPLFWYLLAGLPGLFAYKAVNTLDSMVGYRDARYGAFGWAAARLDDAANLIPARLTGLLIAAAALPAPGARAGRSLAAMARDAGKHRSPNAGWPEAAMGGALDVALAGPRRYGRKTVDDHWIGGRRRDADAETVRRALAVYRFAWAMLAAALLGTGLALAHL